jgi:ketol-acid reductoisomerase
MRYSISDTAEYGDVTRGPRIVTPAVKEEMGRILGEIQDGTFASEWVDEDANGRPNFTKLVEDGKSHPIEQVGAQLRPMMSWISGSTRPAAARDPGRQRAAFRSSSTAADRVGLGCAPPRRSCRKVCS